MLIQTGERPYSEEELKMLIGDDEKVKAIKKQFQRYTSSARNVSRNATVRLA